MKKPMKQGLRGQPVAPKAMYRPAKSKGKMPC